MLQVAEIKKLQAYRQVIHIQNESFFETKVSNFYVHSFF